MTIIVSKELKIDKWVIESLKQIAPMRIWPNFDNTKATKVVRIEASMTHSHSTILVLVCATRRTGDIFSVP